MNGSYFLNEFDTFSGIIVLHAGKSQRWAQRYKAFACTIAPDLVNLLLYYTPSDFIQMLTPML